MTAEQQAAYVFAQAVAAMAEVEGMKAENMQRDVEGNSMAYRRRDFTSVIEEFGISHNAVISLFNG